MKKVKTYKGFTIATDGKFFNVITKDEMQYGIKNAGIVCIAGSLQEAMDYIAIESMEFTVEKRLRLAQRWLTKG